MKRHMHTSHCLLLAVISASLLAPGCGKRKENDASRPDYRVIRTYPHDPTAFTQGLTFDEGTLYESTGRHGTSSVRKVDLISGEVARSRSLPHTYFGEGIACTDNALFQLTWRSGRCFVRDKETLAVQRSFQYDGEGWGLTFDGTHLIMSDGSARLRFIDPNSFETVRTVDVVDDNGPVKSINELEYVDAGILANVWQTDDIIRIDPASGRVIRRINLGALMPISERTSSDAVLNGIAFDPESRRLIVTGKLWPLLFEIQIMQPPPVD